LVRLAKQRGTRGIVIEELFQPQPEAPAVPLGVVRLIAS
jgi:hypothetical protein